MNYWAWGGQYIGFREGDYLFSKKGKPIGVFYDEELFDFHGHYIGEIRNDRLIVSKSKKNRRIASYSKPCNRCGRSYSNYVGNVMIMGYEDFSV